MNCNKCGKELNGKGVWAAHKKIPKLDFAFCGRCWYYDKNPDIAYNGNIQDPRDKSYRHYRSKFHDENDEPFIIPSTPIIYKKGDVEITILSADKLKDKGDGFDRFELLGIIAEHLGKEIKDESL